LVVGFLLAAILVDAFLVSGLLFPVRVTSESMAPALLGPERVAGVDRPGQRVLVDRATLAIRPLQRWEVVVFDCPAAPRDWCVKRVVGLPGERVEVRHGEIWIDGAMAPTPPEVAYASGGQREYTLGPDEYFLLGDNAAVSEDSRTWAEPGVARQRIVGRVLTW
jgi:signal peptidase I